jgi:hypothetical protein
LEQTKRTQNRYILKMYEEKIHNVNCISLQLTFDIWRLHVFHFKSRQVHNVKANQPGLGFIATLRFPRFNISHFDLNCITVLTDMNKWGPWRSPITLEIVEDLYIQFVLYPKRAISQG